MKIKINKQEYVRQTTEIEVEIPETTKYYWHNGIRKAYMVIPKWTTWNKANFGKEEEVYSIDVIKVDPSSDSINLVNLPVSWFPDILKDDKNPWNRLIKNILYTPNEETRTKEQFLQDYKKVSEKIEEILYNG